MGVEESVEGEGGAGEMVGRDGQGAIRSGVGAKLEGAVPTCPRFLHGAGAGDCRDANDEVDTSRR